jgi:hypothetical protein
MMDLCDSKLLEDIEDSRKNSANLALGGPRLNFSATPDKSCGFCYLNG